MMAKHQKSYRLHEFTLAQIKEIRGDSRLPSDVDVIKVAVAYLHLNRDVAECWETLGKIKRAENVDDKSNRFD